MGYFFVCAPLGNVRRFLKGRSRTHGFDCKVLKGYLYFDQKSTFFKGVSPGFLVKNDQILKSAFFTCLCT